MSATKEDTSPPDVEEVRSAALAALDTRITPRRLPFHYHLGLVLVAGAMLLLPLVYLMLIALVAYGVYWHTTENYGILSGGGLRFKAVLYIGPMFVGAILVLFMAKPLLARRRVIEVDTDLERNDQPFLFAFVETLCASMGAPRPARVRVDTQVNASAALDGMWRGMLGGRLILTIGLPLAAGLTLRQLAGVLAHEFGHFAQGAGMRATYAIGAVNAWFSRVVYERDRWDARLLAASENRDALSIVVVANVARGFVWLTRRILTGLMWIAHAISCFLSRQMEYDADHYEIQLAGTEAMAKTFVRLTRLSVASEQAHAALAQAWEDKRLADHLPAFILRQEAGFKPGADEAIEASFGDEKKGALDTHPRTADRIAAAVRANAPGVLTVEGPASLLFDGFDDLCRVVSRQFYEHATNGQVRPEHLVPIETFAEQEEEDAERYRSLVRILQGNATVFRALPFSEGPLGAPEDPDAAAASLAELREKVLGEREAFDRALRSWAEAGNAIIEANSATVLLASGVRVDPESFGIQSATRAAGQRAIGEQEQRRGELGPKLVAIETRAVARLEIALALLFSPAAKKALEEEPSLRQDAMRLHEAARDLGGLLEDAVDLTRRGTILDYLLRQLEHQAGNEKLRSQIATRTAATRQRLADLRDTMGDRGYPFATESAKQKLHQVVLPGLLPGDDNPIAVLGAAMHGADRIRSTYIRTLAGLAWIVERTEDALGFERFPEPPEELLE